MPEAPPIGSLAADGGALGVPASVAACPICGGRLRDWFGKAGRRFARCASCSLISVPQGLARNSAGVSIYEAEDNVFQADGNEGYYFDHETNLANSRLKLAWVSRDLALGARLLDAGSNFGHFLKTAGERYEASGFDLSPAAVAWSREHFGVSAFVGSVYALSPEHLGRYDAVTCWDVIEHLQDPRAALALLRGLLKPRGLFFLSTPDAGSLLARLLGRRWHYLDPLQHINVFSRRNLEETLSRVGFRVVRVGSLGHRYRLRYVFDRLRYLHSRGIVGTAVAAGRWLAGPLLDRSVYLQPGDVLCLTAARED